MFVACLALDQCLNFKLFLFQKLNMILVLDTSYNLVLYTGSTKVCDHIKWAASLEKVPNVRSRCHTKRRYNSDFLVSFSFFKSSYQKKDPSILLLV